ncbi:OmpA family protein [Psychrobium sp. 1_MG-2023]|uniref:OmpA family protein n=1 Tax=Psychrobium sp. 1_MG-2023 TaxID=3062624 RepID=UPI000C33F73E|nr:OmpA family protein [Psychrobium sp. 1_MG-2023]MDP2562187.1 OmpA family protein [Psychrobium sp. 1_MG-2023]PKF58109.1 hypothetical protein CW748_04730 [Alteromonadales bacterium alter-6D02]
MKKTTLTKFLIAPVAFGVMVGTAAAKDVEQGWFVQGNIGQATGHESSASLVNEVADVGDLQSMRILSDKRRSWNIGGGYKFDQNLSVALNITDLGVIELDSHGDHDAIAGIKALSGTATGLTAMYSHPLTEEISAHVRGGLAHLSARSNRTDAGHGTSDGSNSGLTFGVGASYAITSNLDALVDWDRFQFDREVDVISAGVRYTFGEVMTQKAKPAPAPAPVVKPVVEKQPEPAPVVKPAPVAPLKPMAVTVYFGNNSSSLNNETLTVLNNAKSQLVNDRVDTVNVSGFASSTGNAAYNQMLSEKRAKKVAAYIKQNWSVDADKVVVTASGEKYANEAPTGAKARKVTVTVKFN